MSAQGYVWGRDAAAKAHVNARRYPRLCRVGFGPWTMWVPEREAPPGRVHQVLLRRN